MGRNAGLTQGWPRFAVALLLSCALVAAVACLAPAPAPAAAAGLLSLNGGAAVTGKTAVSVEQTGSPFGTRAIVTWDGGSIIRGSASTAGHDYPSQTVARLPRMWSSFNSGSSAATLAFMLADAPATVDAHYDPTADANVCVLMGGAIDLEQRRELSAVMQDLRAYCAARRAAGFTVIVTTFLPRSSPGFEEQRQAYNAAVRAQWPEFADGLADLASDPRIGDPLDCYDTAYYSPDATHPNDGGYAVMAEVTAPLLRALGGSWELRLREASGPWGPWQEYARTLSWELPAGDGHKQVEEQLRDGRGHTASASAGILLDTLPPEVTLTAADGWSRGPVTVAAAAHDGAGGSGVSAVELSVDGGAWKTATGVTVSGDGEHAVRCRATDAAGNVSATREATVLIDGTPPVTTASPIDDGVWHPDGWTVSLSATDALSGVQTTEYRLGETAWQAGDAAVIHSTGQHTLFFRSRDRAGNLETRRQGATWVDADAPVTTVTGLGATWRPGPRHLTLATVDTASGVASAESALDGSAWTPDRALVVEGEGTHTLRVRSADLAGNAESAEYTVGVDSRAPVASIKAPVRCRSGATATVRFVVADPRPGSPSASVTVLVKNASGRSVGRYVRAGVRQGAAARLTFRCRLPRGTYRLTISAVDAAGNVQKTPGQGRLTVT